VAAHFSARYLRAEARSHTEAAVAIRSVVETGIVVIVAICWRNLCTPNRRRILSMPDKATINKARRDKRQGKAPSTQAGEFVHEEIEHVREGKHGARSTKQAIAIGLSKARRAGVKLAPPKGRASARTQEQAERDLAKAGSHRKTSSRRSAAVRSALKREKRSTASHSALSRQATTAARRRSAASRSRAAKKAARTRADHNH
jgi:hypothetical protein